MNSQRMVFSCYSCGKGVEFSPGAPPCEVLQGWISISHWQGSGSVEHHNFCSFGCLHQWVSSRVPKVPEVFLKYFEE